MGEISIFIIGGIVGVVISAVGLEKLIEIMKETIAEVLPIVSGILG
jgi:hypothetical protein